MAHESNKTSNTVKEVFVALCKLFAMGLIFLCRTSAFLLTKIAELTEKITYSKH